MMRDSVHFVKPLVSSQHSPAPVAQVRIPEFVMSPSAHFTGLEDLVCLVLVGVTAHQHSVGQIAPEVQWKV